MSEKQDSGEILLAAATINKKLIAAMKRHEQGVYWETMGLGSDGKVGWEVSESIYCGVGGIALYFMRQYKALGNKEHLDIARDAIKWCRWYVKQDQPFTNSFLTGRIGLALTMLELNAIESQSGLESEAIAMAIQGGQTTDNELEICDYINGIAGRIHGLLHIFDQTKNQEVLTCIDQLTGDLLKRSWLYKDGIYWDRSGQQICGLCGLSHGAGGIGYVFMELARYFENPALNFVARQAMRYEDSYFNKGIDNWPDLRRGSFTAEDLATHTNEYNKGNLAFFEKRTDMNAWCHGAAGIGLVRLEAFRQLGDKKFLKDAKVAIKKTMQTDVDIQILKPNYTLCHGSGGNAEIFLRAYELTGDKKQLTNAKKVAAKAMAFFAKEDYYGSGYAQGGSLEDTSLFMGLAGIGYFYLRTLYPQVMPSLLIPSLESGIYGKKLNGFNFLNADEYTLKSIIFSRYFPSTLLMLPDKKVLDFNEENLYKGFAKKVNEISKELGNKELKKTFQAERKIFEFDLAAPSHALLSIKQILQSQKEEKVLLNGLYRLDKDVMLSKSKEGYLMTSRYSRGLQKDSLPMFTFRVLKAFSSPAKPKKVIEELSHQFGEISAEEKKEVETAINEQILAALSSGKIALVKEN